MASPLTPFSILAPGYFGINTQDAPVEMAKEFALVANNCVIDESGRTVSRKGWAAEHTTNADLGTADVTCIGEVVENDGTLTTICTGNNKIYKLSGTTLTTLTYGGGGSTPTIPTNMQFTQLNGIGILFQRGYDPLIYDPAVSTTAYRRLSEKAGYTGTVPLANTAISAYGRIWCADTSTDKNTVTWCDLITPHIWTAGTSGTLNLVGVWPKGGDEIVALAQHNNFLVIFGKTQTIIYSGAYNPSNMSLYDTLNVGCVSRDSVQNTSTDIIFLSRDGVRSLARTIQEKSAPLNNISRNIHNDFISSLTRETVANIKSGYSTSDSIYVITMPTSSLSYCFDMRRTMENGASPTTTWSLIPKCFCYSKGGSFHFGMAGFIGEYSTHLDSASTYRMSYYSPWLDFGNPIQTSILKKIVMTIVGAFSQSIVVKWGFNFIQNYNAQTMAISGGTPASEYGIAEWGIGEWGASSSSVNVVSAQAGGAGQLMQLGFETEINGYSVSIQKIDIYTKEGRI